MTLEIGKRYWLDRKKNVSGIYNGTSGRAQDGTPKEGRSFVKLEGNRGKYAGYGDQICFSAVHGDDSYPPVEE